MTKLRTQGSLTVSFGVEKVMKQTNVRTTYFVLRLSPPKSTDVSNNMWLTLAVNMGKFCWVLAELEAGIWLTMITIFTKSKAAIFCQPYISYAQPSSVVIVVKDSKGVCQYSYPNHCNVLLVFLGQINKNIIQLVFHFSNWHMLTASPPL